MWNTVDIVFLWVFLLRLHEWRTIKLHFTNLLRYVIILTPSRKAQPFCCAWKLGTCPMAAETTAPRRTETMKHSKMISAQTSLPANCASQSSHGHAQLKMDSSSCFVLVVVLAVVSTPPPVGTLQKSLVYIILERRILSSMARKSNSCEKGTLPIIGLGNP